MFKSKLNIFLGVLLIGIWTILAKKMFFNNTSTIEINKNSNIQQSAHYIKFSKDTFNLDLKVLKRDPFLNKLYSQPLPRKNKTPKKHKTPVKSALKKKWPKIEYLGYVKSEVSSSPLVLLRINNKLKRFRKGSVSSSGLIVKTIFKDSITIKYGNELKSYRKRN